MTGATFTQIILGLITIMGALITAYVIPWIKTKITAEELAKFTSIALLAVRCANQIYTPDQWKEKKAYVMDYLQDMVKDHLNIDLTDEQMSCMVEGLVNEVKNGDAISD